MRISVKISGEISGKISGGISVRISAAISVEISEKITVGNKWPRDVPNPFYIVEKYYRTGIRGTQSGIIIIAIRLSHQWRTYAHWERARSAGGAPALVGSE